MIVLQGTIIRAIGGFYDVRANDGREYRCRARGRLKKEGVSVYVGDRVRISTLSANEGILEAVEPRETLLQRPPVANVDQVVIICAPQDPPLSLQLLDRLLVLAEKQQLHAVICMNKDDLPHDDTEKFLCSLYGEAGYTVLMTSAKYNHGIEDVKRELQGKVSVLAGPSGVGKSSLLNSIQPGLKLSTGEISEKLKRGRHTTRHVKLLWLESGGLVADSPGFSQLDLSDVTSDELRLCFPEFLRFAENCRFSGCRHRDEPDCAVKEAVEAGRIAGSRYDNYLVFHNEVTARERSY